MSLVTLLAALVPVAFAQSVFKVGRFRIVDTGSAQLLWNESLALCEAYGTSLATIYNESDNLEIATVVNDESSGGDCHFGLYYDPPMGRWAWVDTDELASTYQNWEGGEATGLNVGAPSGECVLIDAEGDWQAQDDCLMPSTCYVCLRKDAQVTTDAPDATALPTFSPLAAASMYRVAFNESGFSRDRAEEVCLEEHRSLLASIHSTDDNDLAQDLAVFWINETDSAEPDQQLCWLGMDHGDDSSYMKNGYRLAWLDETNVNYDNWQNGAPDNVSVDTSDDTAMLENSCIFMNLTTGRWGNTHCGATLPCIICNLGAPTEGPSTAPTVSPTKNPTPSPTDMPLAFGETAPPTRRPTGAPTASTPSPTGATSSPSHSPTVSPTGNPTEQPTKRPSLFLGDDPTAAPVSDPPTGAPTGEPSSAPFATTEPAEKQSNKNGVDTDFLVVGIVVLFFVFLIIILLVGFGCYLQRTNHKNAIKQHEFLQKFRFFFSLRF